MTRDFKFAATARGLSLPCRRTWPVTPFGWESWPTSWPAKTRSSRPNEFSSGCATSALPEGSPALADSRLIRLAAAASCGAALSSRQELYPRGMEAGRAIKLSQGALYGVTAMTVDEVRERVRSRYPEAAALPDPPAPRCPAQRRRV